MPRAAILWPQRRSMVSSMPITIGPLGANRSRMSNSNLRPMAALFHRAPAEHVVVAREIAGLAEADRIAERR